MKNKALSLTIISLFATSAELASTTAYAERSYDNSHRSEKQQTRSDAHDNGKAMKAQRSEQPQRQRAEQKSFNSAEKNNAQRTDRPSPQLVERANPQRVEKKSPRYNKSRTPQNVQRDYRREQGNRNARNPVYDRDHRADVPRRHVEARRSFHVEAPQRIVRPHYYRTVPRSRYYLGIRVYRPYGYLYPGFGFYYSDNDAFHWLAFTALTLTIVNQLDEHQQRMHEQALIRATTGEEGDTLYWDDRGASGSVTVLYIGTDSRGREYREFRQTVSAHGRTETSYGSATLRADGTWKVAKLDN